MDTITLTLPTMLAMMRWRGAEPHATVAPAPSWQPRGALAEQDERARAELAGLDPARLDAMVDALVAPREEFYGWLTTTDHGRRVDVRVLAAAGVRTAAVLTAVGDELVTITPAQPSALLTELIARLPAHPVAAGQARNAPKPDFDHVLATSATSANPDLTAIAEIMRRPRVGGGSLYSARRTGAGPRRRVPRPITYVDTADGRWLTQITTNSAGEEWVTIAPARVELLAARLAEQHCRLAG
jgi:ESX secretion-associated protein EspG